MARTRTEERFRVVEFRNRNGTTSYRVTGFLRGGKRVRENFESLDAAKGRRAELEAQFMGQEQLTALRETNIDSAQLKLCELALARLEDQSEIVAAVDFWNARPQRQSAHIPRLDEAIEAYTQWVTNDSVMRPVTREFLRRTLKAAAGRIGNIPLAALDADRLEDYLTSRPVAATTRDRERRGLSQFFEWCMERRRRWIAANPALAVEIEMPERPAPEIYDLEEVEYWLDAARDYREGKVLSNVVLQLFGGLRPYEVWRLRENQWNLEDQLLRLDGTQSKTGRPRVVQLEPVLCAWLRICPPGKPYCSNRDKFIEAAKARRVIYDGWRHTAVSHYFTLTGEYGTTAYWSGNSEQIIKDHYQVRTTKAESARFWALFPDEAQRKAALTARPVLLPPHGQQRRHGQQLVA